MREGPLSIVIAPLPNSMGVGAVGDRRPWQQPNLRRKADAEPNPDKSDDGSESGAGQQSAQHGPVNAALDLAMPAETLFATTLMATQMLPRTLSPNELKLRNSQNWLPPYSALRLKDKLI
jgi:hypothetical protein